MNEPMAGAGHAHHHAGGHADHSPSTGGHPLDQLGCQCGCTGSHAGCVGAVSGINPPAGAAFFGIARDALRASLLPSRVQPAHALDLIRPPSIS